MTLIIKKSDFVKSATKPTHYPEDIFPEFFFAGKSNSGKSSMLNKICNRKKLAITSKTPGRTQLINYFIINNNISFVDIPGYGYASTPKNITASWEKMVLNYISNRKFIVSMFIAVDIRRGIEKLDISMINLCSDFSVSANIMLTKSDKVNNNEKTKMKNKTIKDLKNFNNIINIQTFSAKNGDGVKEALDSISEHLPS
ncbi:MAG: ribosome biogenesis GTP-binding protein YsxC [Gammaproteobacteria bacterium]|jgi:GTP-binding protein|nr:ribosome biogenesis GTP-binding protein YsxC [Gammaproteobacteria bacterium]MBT7603608.1 ribosome biogenesis GTP-binding protein YsxC [Gammaproteobacteria bacterium]